MILSIAAKAQNLYELKYYDKSDEETFLGLFFFTDEENCMLRCVSANGKNYWEREYFTQFQTDDGEKTIWFLPKEAEENGAIYPSFLLSYNEKGEISDNGTVLFQNWEDDEYEDENIGECEYFREVNIASKDSKYFLQFYDQNEEMYKRIMKAREKITNQNVSANNNSGYSNSDVTMHFLMIAASKDKSIGKSVETDLNLAKKEFSEIANKLKIGFKEQVVSGYNYTRANVDKAISSLNPKPQDIVVFIYSGHGFRYDDDTDAYPRIYISAGGEDVLTKNIEMSTTDIFNKITSKNGRLTIFISDCCNTEAGVKKAEVKSVAFGVRASQSNTDISKLQKLFMEQSGSVRATAAKAGQPALCDASGGFLLTSFISNIKSQVSAISKDAPSWNTILENATRAVEKKTSNQIDEAGREMEPQVVVKSIKVKTATGTSKPSTTQQTPVKPSSQQTTVKPNKNNNKVEESDDDEDEYEDEDSDEEDDDEEEYEDDDDEESDEDDDDEGDYEDEDSDDEDDDDDSDDDDEEDDDEEDDYDDEEDDDEDDYDDEDDDE